MNLFEAVEKDDLKLLKELLASGEYDVETALLGGITPLIVASEIGSVEAVEMLLKYGSNINHKTFSKNTPLMRASQYGHFKVVKLLCENGAVETINDKNFYGETALTEALYSMNHTELINILIENGATSKFYKKTN